MENNVDPIGYMQAYFGNNFKKIVRNLTREEREITFQGMEVSKVGRIHPLSTLAACVAKYNVRDKGIKEEKENSFFMKYYPERKEGLPEGFLDSRAGYEEIDSELFAFCEGLDYVPEFYFEALKGKILFFEHIPGRPLEQILQEKTRKHDKIRLIKQVLDDVVSKFYIDIKNRMTDVLREGDGKYRKLMNYLRREEEGSMKKAARYIRAIKSLDSLEQLDLIDKGFRERFANSYWPIAGIYDRRSEEDQISHRNFTPEIILISNEGKSFIMNPEVDFKQPILNVAELLSSPGMNLNPADWNELAESYWDSVASKLGYTPRDVRHSSEAVEKLVLKPFLSVVSGIAGKYKIMSEDAEKKSLGALYRGIIHKSLEKMAEARDVERFFPIIYKIWCSDVPAFGNIHNEMKDNITNALNVLINVPEDYDVDSTRVHESEQSELEALIELRKILFDEKWIEPDDLKPQLKEKNYRKTFQNNPNPETFSLGIETKSERLLDSKTV